jgi:serine/threonine protein kinase
MPVDLHQRLKSVGHCDILAPLGAGGMGVVYRGRHRDLQIDVAIKFLRQSTSLESTPAERFYREARLAARINHPNLVRVYDCGQVENYYYIVMELVEGQSLADHIRERGLLPVGRALQIVAALSNVLDYAHGELGLIHRDIKPANVLLTAAGNPKLADLGLAKSLTSDSEATTQTAVGTALGTPNYMPPEQFLDATQADLRSDIYALGATLYHMLAGQPPFQATSIFALLKQIEQAAPPPLPSHVPAFVQEILMRMLAKQPSQRFQNYGELQIALEAAQRSLGESDASINQMIKLASTTVARPLPSSAPDTSSSVVKPASPTENRVLLVVDIQNDFCPGGALAVPGGDEVIPVINRLARRFAHVILTQDWHCEDHLSFASSHPGKLPLEAIDLSYGEQMLWPDHCIQNTPGAEFHSSLEVQNCELIIRKGYHREIDSYSAFFENDRQTPTGLAGYLRERGLTRVFIVGLATDFCVAYSAIDARRLGFEVTVIESGCRAIDANGSLSAAWTQMLQAGVIRA